MPVVEVLYTARAVCCSTAPRGCVFLISGRCVQTTYKCCSMPRFSIARELFFTDTRQPAMLQSGDFAHCPKSYQLYLGVRTEQKKLDRLAGKKNTKQRTKPSLVCCWCFFSGVWKSGFLHSQVESAYTEAQHAGVQQHRTRRWVRTHHHGLGEVGLVLVVGVLPYHDDVRVYREKDEEGSKEHDVKPPVLLDPQRPHVRRTGHPLPKRRWLRARA